MLNIRKIYFSCLIISFICQLLHLLFQKLYVVLDDGVAVTRPLMHVWHHYAQCITAQSLQWRESAVSPANFILFRYGQAIFFFILMAKTKFSYYLLFVILGQERIAKAHGSQCGFCTPGLVMSMYAFLRNNSQPTMQDIEETFQGIMTAKYEHILK